MPEIDPTPPTPGCVAAILPAAGSGTRFGEARNKLFATLAGKPLWAHAAERLAARPEVGRLVMPIAARDRSAFAEEFAERVSQLALELVPGGATRTDSVAAALEAIGEDSQVRWVAVHDAARPLVPDADIGRVLTTAAERGAAILATPVNGTLKRDLGGQIRCRTVDRRELWIALTPQVFRRELLQQAYAKHRGRAATDDAQMVERLGHHVSLVHGSAENIKITLPEDLSIAEAIIARQNHPV